MFFTRTFKKKPNPNVRVPQNMKWHKFTMPSWTGLSSALTTRKLQKVVSF